MKFAIDKICKRNIKKIFLNYLLAVKITRNLTGRANV